MYDVSTLEKIHRVRLHKEIRASLEKKNARLNQELEVVAQEIAKLDEETATLVEVISRTTGR